MKKTAVLLLCVLLFVNCLTGCREKKLKTSEANLTFTSMPTEYKWSFLRDDGSEILRVDREAAERFRADVASVSPEYAFSELFDTELCMERIFTNAAVKEHASSATDENGNLTAEHLRDLIRENNRKYLENGKILAEFYHEPNEEFLLSLCQLILETVNGIRERYPDVDFGRISCNLANLKVLYKTGLMSFAQVGEDLLMQLGDDTMHMVSLIKGKTAVRNVLMHETVHVAQIGCLCENVEHCERRAGIVCSWDDTTLQGNDWTWLADASAELIVSQLTGDKPVTYQSMIGYLQSVNLACFLHEGTSAGFAQSLCFYDDPGRMFTALCAEDDRERREITQMMEAIQIVQCMPDEFKKAYAAQYHEELDNDENQAVVRRALKPGICLSLTKAFYKNLADALLNEERVTKNDLYYLLRVFEATMEYHAVWTDPEREAVNRQLLENYREIRGAFFRLLQESGAAVDEEDFAGYEMFTEDGKDANASFLWLDDAKREFLLERTEYVKEELNQRI